MLPVTASFAAPPTDAEPALKTFEVAASRYKYEPSTLEVDEGNRVVLRLRSLDVAHGLRVKEFKAKIIIPKDGEVVTLEFVAAKPGTFKFVCSEYCGSGHKGMKGQLVVRPRAAASGPGRPPAPARLSLLPAAFPAPAAPAPPEEDPDLELDRVEPDFTVINLPTTLRLPRHRLAFRVTHRFTRGLGQGDLGDLAGDLFGFDGSALIGLELRFGLLQGTQVGVYRTSDRTIELFVQQHLMRQGEAPVGLAAVASLEGRDNLHEGYSPRVSLVLSRKLGSRAALYAVPTWVGRTDLRDPAPGSESTFVLGLGGRLRLGEAAAVVAELSPRLGGFKGERAGRRTANHATFGLERRVGGHSFQINFSNDLGTTPAQTARGQQGPDDWFLGFNISRKFF